MSLAGPGKRPVRLVTARRASEASSYRAYTEKARAALAAADVRPFSVVEVEMSAEGARGGVIRPTLAHLLRSFPRDGAIYHATEPNTAFRGVDVVTLHDVYPFEARGVSFAVFRLVIRSAARRARRIVTQTSVIHAAIRRHLGEAAAAKTRIVPPAFPAPPPGRLAPEHDVLWVGSLDARKQPELFLDRLAERPGPRLRVAFLCHEGGSPIRPAVEAALARARKAHDVEWTERNVSEPELDRLYRSSRVLVSTSTVEGFHYPVMEAWSRGTRVVLPRLAPYPETYGEVEGVGYYDPRSFAFGEELSEGLAAGPFVPDRRLLDSISFAAIGRRLSAVYDELG